MKYEQVVVQWEKSKRIVQTTTKKQEMVNFEGRVVFNNNQVSN